MEYTESEESRIADIRADFDRPETRRYLAKLGLVYDTLDNARTPSPSQYLERLEAPAPNESIAKIERRMSEIIGEAPSGPMTEEEKRQYLPYRFSDDYLRGLGATCDRALLIAEIIHQAEKQGFEYHIVNHDDARKNCLERILHNPGYLGALDKFRDHRTISANRVLRCMSEKTIARQKSDSTAKVMRNVRNIGANMLQEPLQTEPFAWLEKPSASGRYIQAVDIFGIKGMSDINYDEIYVANTGNPEVMVFDEQHDINEEKLTAGLADYLRA